jgi:hypothetical protein
MCKKLTSVGGSYITQPSLLEKGDVYRDWSKRVVAHVAENFTASLYVNINFKIPELQPVYKNLHPSTDSSQ